MYGVNAGKVVYDNARDIVKIVSYNIWLERGLTYETSYFISCTYTYGHCVV